MKINLIGMILNNAGRRCFDGAILDDNGKPMPAADSLHHMIMEYAKVVNGGTSELVTTSREVLTPSRDPVKRKPTGFVATCQCGAIVGAMDRERTEQHEAARLLGKWLADGCKVEPRFTGSWNATVEACRCSPGN